MSRAALMAAERTIRRVRAMAEPDASPLEWGAYRAALPPVYGDGAELVLVLARDARVRLRVIDGVPHLRADFHRRLVPLPSFEAADELASLAREHCGVDVDPEELALAMDRLSDEAMRRSRARRATRRRAA